MSAIARRRFLLVLGAACFSACKRDRSEERDALACTDVSMLAPDDATARARIAYLDRTNDAQKKCADCTQYVEAASPGSCASCKVIKGPVHPNGTCRLFAKRG